MKKNIMFLFIMFCLIYSSLYSSEFEVAGTIRNKGNGWEIIANSEHKPLNLYSVSCDTLRIKITYTQIASQVITLLLSPDETFSRRGYLAGASVGLSFSYIYIYQIVNGDIVLVDPSTVMSSSGNFWIYGKFEN